MEQYYQGNMFQLNKKLKVGEYMLWIAWLPTAPIRIQSNHKQYSVSLYYIIHDQHNHQGTIFLDHLPNRFPYIHTPVPTVEISDISEYTRLQATHRHRLLGVFSTYTIYNGARPPKIPRSMTTHQVREPI